MKGLLSIFLLPILLGGKCFGQFSTSDSDVNGEGKSRNVTIKCELLEDHELLVQESIKRNSFLYKLEIYGPIVSLSDIPDDAGHCSGHIVIIELFATDKIIFDNDYNSLGTDITFVVAAPTVEIVGKRRIDLRGRDGGMPERPAAKNGNRGGSIHGENGVAGLPGGPGGHFYGIANEIINFDKLTVRVQGGNGGPGQNGGNGVSGDNGKYLNLNEEKINNFKDTEGFNVILQRHVPVSAENFLVIAEVQEVVLGEKGTNGGNGGNGGVGGEGGIPGVYAFINLENRNCDRKQIFKDIQRGNSGRNGKGGRGGAAGFSGKDVFIEYQVAYDTKITVKNFEYYDHDEPLDGDNGENGVSTKGERNPHQHPIWQQLLFTLKRYHDFLLNNMDMSLNVETMHKVIPNVNRILNNVRCILTLVE